MAKKLALLSTNPTLWKLAYETAICVVLLSVVFLSNFHIFFFIVFGGTAFFFYLRSAGKPRRITASFWILIIWSVSALYFLSSAPQGAVPFRTYKIIFLIALFGGALYVLLGLARFFFKNPDFVYEIFSTFLILVGSALLFFIRDFSGLWITSGLLFFGTFLLFHESFNFHGTTNGKRAIAAGFAVALLSMELFAVLSLLPMNFMSNGAVLTLFFLTVRYIILSHYDGTMHTRFLFNKISIFVIILLVISALGQWSL